MDSQNVRNPFTQNHKQGVPNSRPTGRNQILMNPGQEEGKQPHRDPQTQFLLSEAFGDIREDTSQLMFQEDGRNSNSRSDSRFSNIFSNETTLPTRTKPFSFGTNYMNNVPDQRKPQNPFRPMDNSVGGLSTSLGASKNFTPEMGFSQKMFFDPIYGSTEEPVPMKKQEETPITTLPIDEKKDPKGQINPLEEILQAIQKYQINCVSLLNEVGSKVKKKVDYLIKEVPTAKTKIFECSCILDKDKIGFGKANSKQGSKSESALEGVKTLLTKEQFTYEKAHITLSVQKTAGIGVYSNNQKPTSTPTNSGQDVHEKIGSNNPVAEADSQSKQPQNPTDSEATLMNDSALYELNLIAKECFIEPLWEMSAPRGPNGEFETRVTFDKLEATGKGRKKLDAKRDAALKIIQQIRSSKELSERYNPKAKKQLSPSNSQGELVKNDQRKKLFENSLDSKLFGEMTNSALTWKDSILKLEKNFESYASNIIERFRVSKEDFEAMQEFFKQMADYTEMATFHPKQILLDAPKHIADYVTECSLVPIGSFALDCMRKDNLTIDVLFTFKEVGKISEEEILKLYCASLAECQKIGLEENPEAMKMEFRVESSERGNILVVKTDHHAEKFVMQVQILAFPPEGDSFEDKSEQSKRESSIIHISRIYECLDNTKLKALQDLMILMRIWKKKNGCTPLASEILDAILLNEVLSNPNGNLTTYIINCLTIMNSEENFQFYLKKFGKYYVDLYNEIPSKMKWQVSSKATQSVEAIYNSTFDKSGF